MKPNRTKRIFTPVLFNSFSIFHVFLVKKYVLLGSCYISVLIINISITIFRTLLNLVQRQPAEVFYKKGALRNFANFTEKHLSLGLFFNKVENVGLKLY